MKRPGVLILVAACVPHTHPKPEPIRPAVLEWLIGLDREGGPVPMVETVLPARFEGREVWRIMHLAPDPTVSAVGPVAVQTALGRCAALEVVIAPRDGWYRMRQWVRAAAPH